MNAESLQWLAELDNTQNLLEVGATIDFKLNGLLAERQRVNQEHPYLFGMVLWWLTDEVESGVSRFEMLQRAGCWPQVDFVEWANAATQVSKKTWQEWLHVCKSYFATDGGESVVKAVGGPAEFVKTVTMDKAIRALPKVVKETLQPHQKAALLDAGVTSEGLRHALRVDDATWQAEQEYKTAPQARKWVEYDPSQRTAKLKQVNGDGEYQDWLLARFPVSTPEVELLQQTMLKAAQLELESEAVLQFNELVSEVVK